MTVHQCVMARDEVPWQSSPDERREAPLIFPSSVFHPLINPVPMNGAKRR
jgi:hypothetical protein